MDLLRIDALIVNRDAGQHISQTIKTCIKYTYPKNHLQQIISHELFKATCHTELGGNL